ncbi:MAG TPA: alpha-amylase family glycosyl hydrolase, partial [Candidatus Paceibacterota bacterium]|nr:alpha-amylase family glycosyl hydrolase [Candidatus Paceibacterota bacterium]
PGFAREARAEFWSDAIQALRRKHPGFVFIAEVYWGLEEHLQSLGFDFTYNKELYDEILRCDFAAVRRRLLNAAPEFLSRSVNFLENHDERRIASVLAEAEHRAAAVLILSLPGCRLLHEGQLNGAQFRTPVQLFCRVAEPIRPAIRDFYERLLTVLKQLPPDAGACRIIAPAANGSAGPAENVILLIWRGEGPEFWLIAVNLGSRTTEVFAPVLSESGLRAGMRLEDRLDWPGSPAELTDAGILVALPPYAARLLHGTRDVN